MSAAQWLVVAAVVGFVFVTAPYAGGAAAFIGAYVITLGGLTSTLWAMNGATSTVPGITDKAITVSLEDVALVAALIAIWAHRGRLGISWALAAFVLPALVLVFTTWGNTSEQWSGIKLYLTAFIAFGIGRWLSDNMTDRAELVIVLACLAACAAQFIFAVAQSRGLLLLGYHDEGTLQWIRGGRMVGLYNHPAYLGKTVLLLFCFILPLTASPRRVPRRVAYLSLILGSVATLLTVSRANVVAIGAAIVLWLFLSGRAASAASRVAVVVGAVALLALNASAIGALESRQLADPEGGERAPIFTVGMEQIARSPWTGTGPNYYCEIVGRYDTFCARGYPLHNSFLYPIAELGIPLAIVLFLPLAIAVARTIGSAMQRRGLDPKAAALLSLIPGLAVVGWTGWGLIAAEGLPLWFLGFGYLTAPNMAGRDESPAVNDAESLSQSQYSAKA